MMSFALFHSFPLTGKLTISSRFPLLGIILLSGLCISIQVSNPIWDDYRQSAIGGHVVLCLSKLDAPCTSGSSALKSSP